MTELLPCILERKIVPKVWGGRALEAVLGLELPAGEQVGETWELYDRPDGASRIRDRDETVHDLLERDRRGLLGGAVEATPQGLFPLAVKFLDAAEPLSVQVHPDAEQAAEDDDDAKSEAWVVLQADEGARISRGFRAGVTREAFAAVASTEAVVDQLETFAPAAGDAVHLPPGTVHTLGPGVVVCEVQRNSDLTYRFFDWGRPRDLHLEQALRAARFDRLPESTVTPEPIAGGGEWVVREPGLGLRRFALEGHRTLQTDGGFLVLTMLSGYAAMGWKSQGEHEPLRLRQGDTVLVPAGTGEVFVSPVGMAVLLVSDAREEH